MDNTQALKFIQDSIKEVKEKFGEIPEDTMNEINELCDTFMEIISNEDPEAEEAFKETQVITFYVGLMQGIKRGQSGETCPLADKCTKKNRLTH